MSVKVHLFRAQDPHKEDSAAKVACGVELKNARAVYLIDYSVLDVAISVSGFCRKCVKRVFDMDDKKHRESHLLYGLVNSQEAMLEKSLGV